MNSPIMCSTCKPDGSPDVLCMEKQHMLDFVAGVLSYWLHTHPVDRGQIWSHHKRAQLIAVSLDEHSVFEPIFSGRTIVHQHKK